jgi:citrate lyase beta subunit
VGESGDRDNNNGAWMFSYCGRMIDAPLLRQAEQISAYVDR